MRLDFGRTHGTVHVPAPIGAKVLKGALANQLVIQVPNDDQYPP